MVRMYKAGAAYVEVVPVFKDFQRLVAKHLKENLANKDLYKDLEGNLRKSVDQGLENIDAKMEEKLKDAGLVVQKEGKKTGEKIAKSVNKGVKDELDFDNAITREIRAFGKKVDRDLGDAFLSSASKLKGTRKEIQDNLRLLSKAYQDEGAKSADEIEKAYDRIEAAMRRVAAAGVGDGGASESDMALIEDNLKKFQEKRLRITKGYSNARIAQIKADAAAEKKAREQAEKDREKARKAEEKALEDAAEARRKAEAEKIAALEKADRDWRRVTERQRKEMEKDGAALVRNISSLWDKALAEDRRFNKAREDELKAFREAEESERKAREAAEAAELKMRERAERNWRRIVERKRKRIEADGEKLFEDIDKAWKAALTQDRKFNEAIEQNERIHSERMYQQALSDQNRQRRLRMLGEAEEIRAQARAEARDKVERSYRSLHSTARDEWREVGADDARGNAKQQRLIESRRKVVQAAQRELNSYISALSKIPSVNPKVKINTTEARERLRAMQSDIAETLGGLALPRNIVVDTEEAERSLTMLRAAAEQKDEFDWDIDVNSEEARAAIEKLKLELESIKDEEVDLTVAADRASLAETVAEIKRALSTIHRADIEVDLEKESALKDIEILNMALENLRDKRIGVDITEKDALADIAVIRSSLEALDEKDVEIDVDIDKHGQFRRDLAELDAGLDRAQRGARLFSDRIERAAVSMNETTQAFRVFNPMLAGLAIAGAPAISSIGMLTAGLGGLVSMAPGLIGGVSALGFAFTGLEESMKKYSKAQEAIDIAKAGGKLTKAQETAIANWEGEKDAIGEATIKWIEYTDTLKTSLREIQKGAREGLFPGLQKSIETLLGTYAEPLQDFLNRMGKGLGFVAEQWSNSLITSEAQAWFGRVADDALLYTLNMAEAGSNLVSGFAGLTDAFRPFAQELSQYLIDATGRFDEWANALGSNAKFDQFLSSVKNVAPAIGDLAKNIGEFFINASIAVEPFTLAILDAVNGALDFVNALDPKVLGAILGAVGGLMGGLMLLSGVVAGVGAVAAVMGAALSTPFTAAVTAIGSFLAVSSTALGMTTAMSSAGGVLGDVMGNLGGALEGASDFTKDLWGAMGNLLNEVVVPLMPVLSQIVGDFINLGVELGGGILIPAIDGLATVLGIVVDLFTALPTGLQEGIVMFGGLALAIKPVTGLFEKITTTGFYALQGLSDRFAANGKSLEGMAGKLKDTDIKWGSLNGTMGNAGAAIGIAGGGMQKAGRGLGGLARGIAALEAASGIIGLIALAATGLSFAFSKINEKAEPTASGVDGITAAIEGMGHSAEAASASLDKIFTPKEGDTLGSKALLFGPEIREAADAMDYYAQQTARGKFNMEEFNNETGTLWGLLGDTPLDAINKQLDDTDQALADMAGTDFQAAADGFNVISRSMEDAGMSQKEITDRFSDYRGELENTAASLGLANDKSIDYYDWMKGNVPPSVEAAVEAQGRQEEGLKGVTSKTDEAEKATRDLIAANDELAGRFLSQEEANVAYHEALDKFEEHIKSATKTMDVNTEAGQKNRREFAAMAKATSTKADADLEATGNAKQYTETMWNQRKELKRLAKDFGMTDEEAGIYANTLLGIPRDVETKADLKDHASRKAKIAKGEIEKFKKGPNVAKVDADTQPAKDEVSGFKKWFKDHSGVTMTIWAKIKESFSQDKGSGSKKDKGGNTSRNPMGRYHGGIDIVPMAAGGVLSDIAQMVPPNTWRLVGDRMDVDEAFIPIDGSPRSWKILLETLKRMPGMIPFHDGGIAAFAAGAVAAPGAPAPAAPGAPKGEAEQALGDQAITEAMNALIAALGDSWSAMLEQMQTSTEAFYVSLLGTMTAQNALMLTAEKTHFATSLAALQGHLSLASTAWSGHYSKLSSKQSSHQSASASSASSFRSGQQSAESAFYSSLLSKTESGTRQIRNAWSSHHDGMSGITSAYRERESSRNSNFLQSTLLGQISRFGRDASNRWSDIWNDLVASATRIFGTLPPEIGQILSSVSGKMNTHIVKPYNKVVSDMDLGKKLKLQPFPTQAYRDGGMMKGYTPGRDVHKFFSPTGGILELSGGEPVLRPEVGAVVGSDWVDGVNAAARTQGISGVKKFLGGHQAHANGGFIESQAFANGGRIKKDSKGIVQLGKLLQSMGVRVSEHPAFGSVGRHSRNSWHYRAGALDLNTAPGTSAKEMRDFDRIMPLLYKLGWGVIWRYPNHYGHAHVDIGNRSLGSFNRNPSTSGDLWEQLLKMRVGPATGGGGSSVDFFDLPGEMETWLGNAKKAIGGGAVPDLMLGVGNKIFSALADAKSDEFMESAMGGFGNMNFSNVANGPVKKMAKSMLEEMGWGDQFRDLDWLLTRESSWNPNAQNPTSTAYGLFQFLNSTWGTVGGRKTSDPRKQLEYGLRYIRQRYGDIRGARAFWSRNHWYKDGTSGIEIPTEKAATGTSGLAIPPTPDLDLRPDAIFRDGGGPLPTGYSTVLNNLGHEETILPATPHEVTKTFRELKEVVPTGDGGVTVKDSVFYGGPQETAQEIHREARIQRIGRTVKF